MVGVACGVDGEGVGWTASSGSGVASCDLASNSASTEGSAEACLADFESFFFRKNFKYGAADFPTRRFVSSGDGGTSAAAAAAAPNTSLVSVGVAPGTLAPAAVAPSSESGVPGVTEPSLEATIEFPSSGVFTTPKLINSESGRKWQNVKIRSL